MTKREKYNSGPVWYCRECLSLTVLNAGGRDYCRDCGSTDISWAPLERWDWLYRNRYGHRLLDEKVKQKSKGNG